MHQHYRREQEARNQILIEMARSMKLPLLATNGVSHGTEQRRDLQDVLTCIQHKTTLAEAGILLNFNAERHMKTSDEMRKLFADVPDAFANTTELGNRLAF